MRQRKGKFILLIVVLMALALAAACQSAQPVADSGGEVVEVTRVVTETQVQEVEVTRVVEGTPMVETVVEEVEVTRIVEVAQEGEGTAGCDIGSPAEKTRVNMIGWTYPIQDYYAEELEKCNAVENLVVNTQLLDSGSAHDQIRLALSSGDTSPYDIIMNDVGFVPELAHEGWLLPLDDLIEKYRDEYNLDDILQSLWDNYTIDGHIYAIPLETNTMHLFYRPDLLEKYNLEVPATYDDVIAACPVLKQEESIDLPFSINLHAGWAWRAEFHNMLGAYGGKWLNDDGTPAFNGPEGVAAVEKLLEVVDACLGEEGLTWSIDDTEIGMETGALAMANTWASRAANMDDPEKSEYVGQIAFAPAPSVVPGGPHAGPAGGAGYSIPVNTTVDPDLIFRIIMEAADLESQIRAAELGIASRAEVANSVDIRYLSAALETIADGAGSYGKHPAIGLAQAAIANWLPKVYAGEVTVQEGLDAAAEEYVREATTQGFLE